MKTTIRVELAKRKMTIKDLQEATGAAWETVSPLLDGDYDGARVSTLRKIEEALPGVKLVVRFEVDDPRFTDTQAPYQA